MKTMTKNIAGACVCSMRIEFNLRHNAIARAILSLSNDLLWTVEKASKRKCGRESIDAVFDDNEKAIKVWTGP